MSNIPNIHRIVCMLLKCGRHQPGYYYHEKWLLQKGNADDCYWLRKYEEVFWPICIPYSSCLGKAITSAWRVA